MRCEASAGTGIALPFGMSVKMTLALLVLALALGSGWRAISWPAPADVRQKIAWFHDHPDSAGLAKLRPTESFATLMRRPAFEKLMSRRAELGRMTRSSEAMVQDLPGSYRLVIVYQNTEFERGSVLETFNFRMEADGPRLDQYRLEVGKRMWCPMVTLYWTQCETEDAPTTSRTAADRTRGMLPSSRACELT